MARRPKRGEERCRMGQEQKLRWGMGEKGGRCTLIMARQPPGRISIWK
jgi:hypothetical protein